MRSIVPTDTRAFRDNSPLVIKIFSRYLFREFISSPCKLEVIWHLENPKLAPSLKGDLFRSPNQTPGGYLPGEGLKLNG